MKSRPCSLTRYIMISSLFMSSCPKLNAFRTAVGIRSLSTCVSSSHQFTLQVENKPSSIGPSRSLVRLNSNFSIGNEAAATNDERTDSSNAWQNPRSRWARRKHRKKMERLQQEGRGDEEDEDSNGLSWDKFEFGDR